MPKNSSRQIGPKCLLPNGPSIASIRRLLELTAQTLCIDVKKTQGVGWSTTRQSSFEKCDPHGNKNLIAIASKEALALFSYLDNKVKHRRSEKTNFPLAKIKMEDVFVKRWETDEVEKRSGTAKAPRQQTDYQQAYDCVMLLRPNRIEIQVDREHLELLVTSGIEEIAINSGNFSLNFSSKDRDNQRSRGSALAEISSLSAGHAASLPNHLALTTFFTLCGQTNYPIAQLVDQDDRDYELFRVIESVCTKGIA